MNEKYRAWHFEEKKMCQVSLINFEMKGAFLVGVNPNEGQYYPEAGLYVPPVTNGRFCDEKEFDLMPCVGLLDKNGVEIYRGDIDERGFELKFGYYEDLYGWYWSDHISTGKYNKYPFVSNTSEIAIVSNIYESSGLLK